jgi:Casein kinase substrate phosphoprotein PP28
MWRDPKDKVQEESSEEEESSSEEESDDGGLGSSKTPGESEMTREQRREATKLKKQAAIARKNKKVAEVGDMPTDSEEEEESDDEDMPANPNHTAKARNQARAPTAPPTDAPKKAVDKENLSRREREALQAQLAKERYQKLHAEGKTDEARADLARLKLVREQRDAAAARKQAEKEEEDARANANKEKLEKEKAKRDAALGPSAAKKMVKGKK